MKKRSPSRAEQTSYSNMSNLFVLYSQLMSVVFQTQKTHSWLYYNGATNEELCSGNDSTNIISVWFWWTETIAQWARSSHGNSVSNHSKSALCSFPFITWLIYCCKDFPQWLPFNNFSEGIRLNFHLAFQIWQIKICKWKDRVHKELRRNRGGNDTVNFL